MIREGANPSGWNHDVVRSQDEGVAAAENESCRDGDGRDEEKSRSKSGSFPCVILVAVERRTAQSYGA